MNLSKSLYTKGIQCSKALWLKKYKPKSLTQPDESAQATSEIGKVVGNLACELFSNGKEVPFTRNYDEMIATTKQLLEQDIPNISRSYF